MLTVDRRGVLIHKSSINIVNKDPHFPSPYFVFGEKVRSVIDDCMMKCIIKAFVLHVLDKDPGSFS